MPPDLSMPMPDDRFTVVCLYCGKPQEVGKRTITMTCKFCTKSLRIEDVLVKDYTARRSIETCGIVSIDRKGQVVTDKIICGGLVVRGKVKGHVTSRGPVLVSPEGEIKGDVTAPTVAIGAGAILEGRYRIGKFKDPPPQQQPSTHPIPSTPGT